VVHPAAPSKNLLGVNPGGGPFCVEFVCSSQVHISFFQVPFLPHHKNWLIFDPGHNKGNGETPGFTSRVNQNYTYNLFLKEKYGLKWICDMFNMITSWGVHLGAKKRM
jgi:hypothetical protein